jgi:hypothetical protein
VHDAVTSKDHDRIVARVRGAARQIFDQIATEVERGHQIDVSLTSERH